MRSTTTTSMALALAIAPALANGGPPPRVEGTWPPGATRGATTQWTVHGSDLAKADRVVVSGSGVAAKIVGTPGASSLQVEAVVAPDAPLGVRELRVVGPEGPSNLASVSVDWLPQVLADGPKDSETVHRLPVAVAAKIEERETEIVRFLGRKGDLVLVDVEARRLGTPITPLLTIEGPGGPLVQAYEVPGLLGDTRALLQLPDDGTYLAMVRDVLYVGGPRAHCRVRLVPGTPMTGVFPLGGPAGTVLTVQGLGGDSKTVLLPERPGETIDPGDFVGPNGPQALPFRLIAARGPEVFEGPEPVLLPIGATANGRISAPGEVDRYAIEVKAKQKFKLKVRAGELGSWLDSVVTIRGTKGELLADNDEPPLAQRVGSVQWGPTDPIVSDSLLDYEPTQDGTLNVEVRDREGRGGPEFAYRLERLPSGPEWALVALMRENAQVNARVNARARPKAGADGSLVLRPGSLTAIDFQLSATEFSGAVTVQAEGLPSGVSAEPVKAKVPLRGPRNVALRLVTDRIVIKVAKDARPGTGELRLLATATLEDQSKVERWASFPVTQDAVKLSAPGRPVVRELRGLFVGVTTGP